MTKSTQPATAYERFKARASDAKRQISAKGREIGELPPVQKPKRRKKCAREFRLFCESYLAESFPLAWSPDHLTAIAKIEAAVLRGELFAFAMPRGSGKALALDTPLPTPSGWTTMGDVMPGDELYDESGAVCRVTFATEVMNDRECYLVTFDDGEAITCCGDHLWTVNDRFSRKNPLTLRTADMADRVVLSTKRGWKEVRYTIPVAMPLSGKDSSFFVNPYILGVWLGDGHTAANRVTIGDCDAEEMLRLISCHEKIGRCSRSAVANAASYTIGKGMRFRTEARLNLARNVLQCSAMGWTSSQIESHLKCSSTDISNTRFRKSGQALATADVSLKCRLNWLGVIGNKHIPREYLRASEQSRMELLRGLMDTDGSIDKKGRFAEYVTKLPRLRDDVMELVASLGYKCRYRTKVIDGTPYYRVTFSPTDGRIVFALPRKAARQRTTCKSRISRTRRIVSIEKVDSVPVRCIQVDSPNSLYLCGKSMIPTHNTTLCEAACLWAMLYGHRQFIVLVGADQTIASSMADSLKAQIENNDTLLEDFPEACYPVRALDRIAQRAKGQTYQGRPTEMDWAADQITLPFIKGSPSAGACVRVAGITGRIRGLKHTRPDGKTIRPSLVLIDDCQTDESAASPSQCQTRERILSGAILGLAGPGSKIAGLCTITVIRPDDLADRLLDRARHPAWQGERTKLVYEWPTAEDLWLEYGELRRSGQRNGNGTDEANAFYAERQAEMDAGSRVAWPERKNDDELSAIQHAWNLRIDRGEAAFWAEYQNQPIAEDVASDKLDKRSLAARATTLEKGIVPASHHQLTAFIDVQDRVLFWLVASWSEQFGGHVVQYGVYPDQGVSFFEAGSAKRTLAKAAGGAGFEASLTAGLDKVTQMLLSKDWKREDGTAMRVSQMMIDANWGKSTQTVRTFVKRSAFATQLLPSHGRGIGASSPGLCDRGKARGDRIGLNWRIGQVNGQRSVTYDTNYWKSFVAARLRLASGDPEAIMFCNGQHDLLFEHLTNEYPVRTESSRGRVVDEWKLSGTRFENHWWDCLVGSAVAASIAGVNPVATEGGTRNRKKVAIPTNPSGKKVITVKRL